jgi:hypothetical protein
LRLNLKPSVLLWTRLTNHEESLLPQRALRALEKKRRRSHHSPWLLQDQVGKTSSLQVPDLWEDVLLDDPDTLLSTPPPSGYV